jgi:hypothetical protein
MWLDQQRLAHYIGSDTVFEREYLALLVPTVQQCIDTLSGPSAQTYSTLHAAKPGITVAAHPDLVNLIAQACDLTLPTANNASWAEQTPAVLAQLKEQLEALKQELLTALA